MATVYIGHASCDENSRAHGGAAGDQTGREVYKRTWYYANWDLLLRPRSKAVAKKMVQFVTDICVGNMSF